MHIHLPKPLHGWREFLGEVGIITLGVLIALAAEQLIEHWHWQTKAKEANERIERELAKNAGVFDARVIYAGCRAHMLGRIRAIIVDAAQTNRLPYVSKFPGIDTAPLQTAAWDSAIADGSIAHLRQDRVDVFQALYSKIKEYQARAELEEITWARLHAIRHPGRISDALSADLIGQADEAFSRMVTNYDVAATSLKAIRELGIQPNYDIALDGHGTRRDVIDFYKAKKGCDGARVMETPQP